jgi:hypothetical protein
MMCYIDWCVISISVFSLFLFVLLFIILSSSGGVAKRKRKSKGEEEGDESAIKEKGVTMDVLKAAQELVKKRQKKIVVTETKKFAGQAIR